MRLYAQIAGESVLVNCEPDIKIAEFVDIALKKYKKLKMVERELKVWEVRKTLSHALIDVEDVVKDVLRDTEFVLIALETDLFARRQSHPIVGKLPTKSKVVHTPEDSLFHFYKNPDEFVPPSEVLELDGESLTTEDLVKCGRGLYEIKLSKTAEERIVNARKFLNKIMEEERIVYGITTGFGNFSQVNIPSAKIAELQENLIRSHCCGVGPPIPPSRGRMLLALRINVLAKGHSGVSLEVIQHMIDAFNAFCISWIPEKGSVGCSGDLAPLAHLTLGLMGEGMMWSPETGWDDAKKVLRYHGLTPVKLHAKEGISLVNGTQMVTALGAEAVERAKMIALQADVIAALTLDVLRGTARAFVKNIHKVRPHNGQIAVAKRLRQLLHSDSNPSQIAESHRFCDKVQDSYSLRCMPQVHGIVHDTIEFCQKILLTELNSATDNPLIFEEVEEVISNGNFHGEYPGKVLDYLAIAVHELSQISERRLERLLNKEFSGLPPFLVKDGGLNSGFMMVQVTAASLVSENKVLCHPSTVDSIPTSGGQEDHVSMGGFAARKALRVIEHVEQVLAMEYLAACQAMEFLKPLTTTSPLQEVYKLLRTVVEPLDRDRYMATDIESATKLLQNGEVWDAVQPYFRSLPDDDETSLTIPISPTEQCDHSLPDDTTGCDDDHHDHEHHHHHDHN